MMKAEHYENKDTKFLYPIGRCAMKQKRKGVTLAKWSSSKYCRGSHSHLPCWDPFLHSDFYTVCTMGSREEKPAKKSCPLLEMLIGCFYSKLHAELRPIVQKKFFLEILG